MDEIHGLSELPMTELMHIKSSLANERGIPLNHVPNCKNQIPEGIQTKQIVKLRYLFRIPRK